MRRRKRQAAAEHCEEEWEPAPQHLFPPAPGPGLAGAAVKGLWATQMQGRAPAGPPHCWGEWEGFRGFTFVDRPGCR